MPDDRICPECGRSLPADAWEEVCPVCALQGLLKFVTDSTRTESQESGRSQSAPLNPSLATRFGDYELLELLARGGMGVVYKARQVSLNRTVALKMIQAGLLASPAEIKRFRAEAEAIAHLQHPNIVAVHEIGEHDGQHYFSMDYVPGRTLADLVRDGPLPGERAVTYMRIVATAVHYAHQHGIIHRDLKPANIIIDENDQPRITDFGLAKKLADHQLSTVDHQLTLSGQVLGSPNYLPPEQAEPKRAAVGPASDVYAIGAILYHLVTGRPPFQAESLTTLLREVVETEAVAPCTLNPSIPRDLETICLKCLEKEPHRRYKSAQALAEDLGRFLNHEPVLARPISRAGRSWRWCRRQPVRAGLVAALAAALIAGTAGVLWQWRQARANAAAEVRQRQLAVASRVEAENREYAANIALAQSLIQAKQFDLVRKTLLERTKESARGWEWGWLLRNCHQDQMTLSSNLYARTAASFSPDSRFLATSGWCPEVAIWDLATGALVQTLPGHTGLAAVTPFSPDGQRLCTVNWDGADRSARVWDMATKRELFRPLVHPSGILDAKFSPDGRRLATACSDGKVRVFDAFSGAETGLSNDYGDVVACVEFSPDGHRIAYGGGSLGWVESQDTSIRIWDLVTGETRRLPGHALLVYSLAWSPNGKLLVSCGMDGKIKAWDPDSGTELPGFEASPKQHVLFRLAFSPDGRLLGVAGGDDPNPTPRATLFDVPTRRVVRDLSGHSEILQNIRFSPDGRWVVTSSMDYTAKIWSVIPPPTFVRFEGHHQAVWTAAFSPDGRRVATGGFDQTARLWDAENGVLLRTFVVRFPVVSLAFSPDGQRLLTVGPENSACIWSLEAINTPRSSRRQEAHLISSAPELDQSLLSSAATQKEVLQLRGHTRAVMAVAWSPDGRWVATGSKDTLGRLWDAATGSERLKLVGHSNIVHAVAFSPDGKVLATGSADDTVRLWSTESGQCLQVLAHQRTALSLAFSPDAHLLATGSDDGSARLWDMGTGRQVQCLSGHFNGVNSVSFSPDGRRLVTTAGGTNLHASFTREPRVFFWDVASGRQLLTLAAHDNAVYSAAFSPDGLRLLTTSGDHTARILTTFPWRSSDYPGDPKMPFSERVERYKREFWKLMTETQKAADAQGRSWTNGFHIGRHMLGDMNLPPAGSKRQPLLPIPPRPAQAGMNQVDLDALYNVGLNEIWQPLGSLADLDRSLAMFPAGLQNLGGVLFDVRGILQLRGMAPDSEIYPERGTLDVHRAFVRLHALHGTTWYDRPGREIGAFVLRYANGENAEMPIEFGKHLRGEESWLEPQSHCPAGRLAWEPASLGTMSASVGGRQNSGPRVYVSTFVNPKPTLEVARIEYVSKLTGCGPFLVALTVE